MKKKKEITAKKKMTLVERALILKYIRMVVYILNKVIGRLVVDSLAFNLLYKCRENAITIEMIIQDFGPKKKKYNKNSFDHPLF